MSTRHPERVGEPESDSAATQPAEEAVTRSSRRTGVALHLTAGVITALVLAPIVQPGYVLTYDMVFVPYQGLSWNLVAPSASLPRAVPEDAVVSLLNLAVPGWLLQRMALIGIVYLACLGAGRLVPARRLATRVVAAVAYGWTPFLAERLLLGQWGLLLAYAALPWLVAGVVRLRAGQPGGPARILVAAGICAIGPTGGVIALATTAALTIRRGAGRRSILMLGGVALLNLPWVVTAFTGTASGRTDPVGVTAFAARAENWAGPFAALAGTGGIWNALTTPASRGSIIAPVVTATFVVLAGFGLSPLRRRWPPGLGTAALAVAGAGFVTAALGILPGTTELLAWAVREIPGAGILRDGQKYLIPYALLLSLTMALSAERVAARLAPARARLVLGALVVLPLVSLPDLAFGGVGALRPVSYPDDWDRVAALVEQAPGPVLALPFNPYRSFSWNNRRTVLDPAPRYLPAPVMMDDELLVGPYHIAGESPQAATVRTVLAAGDPVSRLGVRWVLVERDAGGSFPASALTGLDRVYSGDFLDLYGNPQAVAPQPLDPVRRWFVGTSDVLAALIWLAAVACLCRWPTRASGAQRIDRHQHDPGSPDGP